MLGKASSKLQTKFDEQAFYAAADNQNCPNNTPHQSSLLVFYLGWMILICGDI